MKRHLGGGRLSDNITRSSPSLSLIQDGSCLETIQKSGEYLLGGPRGGPWTRSIWVVHGPEPWGGPWTGSIGEVHGPGGMFCIRPSVTLAGKEVIKFQSLFSQKK